MNCDEVKIGNLHLLLTVLLPLHVHELILFMFFRFALHQVLFVLQKNLST